MLKIMSKKEYDLMRKSILRLTKFEKENEELKTSLETARKEIEKLKQDLEASEKRHVNYVKKQDQKIKTSTKKWLNGYPGEEYTPTGLKREGKL